MSSGINSRLSDVMNGSGLFQGGGAANRTQFTDPFLLPSNEGFPIDFESSLDFCLYLYYMNEVYRQASKRLVGHFVTDVTFTGKTGDKEEQDAFRNYLWEGIKVFNMMLEMGDDWAVYGNAFVRINFPFQRSLVDTRSGMRKEYALEIFENFPAGIKYHYAEMEYEVTDPRHFNDKKKQGKGATVRLKFVDRDVSDWSQISLRKIDPRRVVLHSAFMSGKTRVVWEIEPDFLRQIQDGTLYQVNETPYDILKAIAEDKDYKFLEDEVFHLRAPAISGISNFGWGFPEVLANYRNLHQLQVYRKIDEVVGLDYVLPFRVFTPGINESDLNTGSTRTMLSHWKTNVSQMIKQRRQDPFKMYAMPFPVQMNEFGADHHELAGKDQIEWYTDHTLDGMGFPAELFHGSLNIEQVPTALRLFENSFHFLPTGFNTFVKWVTRRTRDYCGMEQIELQLQRPRIADDIEKRPFYMQMSAGGEISRQTAWKDLNITDATEEVLSRVREDTEIEKGRNEIMQEFERESQIGSINDQVAMSQEGAAGGAPQGGGMTPLDVMDQAAAKAEELLAIPYQGERTKALRDLKQSDPQQHALVSQAMEERRAEGASSGRQQVQGQPQQ